MELDRKDRWMLYNQHKILAKLYPDEAGYYDRAAEAIGDGYQYKYGHLAQHIYERSLSEDQCVFVYSVMGMFMRLKWAYEDLSDEDKAHIPIHEIGFRGFDGNNETMYMGYARWIVKDGRSFQNIKDGGDSLNSHMPTLSLYRNMLAVWKSRSLETKEKITKDDIVEVTSAKY